MNEKLKNAIEKSGNNLHLQVAKTLEDLGWEVNLSAYYYDDTTGKPREIDIIARNAYLITINGEVVDTLYATLFIECKYFIEEVAFRMQKNFVGDAKDAVILKGLDKEETLEQQGLAERHRYMITEHIAKLYDTHKDNENNVFNALTQPVKSLTFFKERTTNKGIYVPIVIYDGIDNLHTLMEGETELTDKTTTTPNTIYGYQYSYRNYVNDTIETNYFYVDVVRISELNKIIQTINADMRHLQGIIEFGHKIKKQQNKTRISPQ